MIKTKEISIIQMDNYRIQMKISKIVGHLDKGSKMNSGNSELNLDNV